VYDSEKEAEGLMNAFLNFNTISSLLFNLFMMALLPAIGEEFLFRGLIQKLLRNITRNKHVAVWGSAIIFSAFHMQFLGFFPRMILGAMFGYMVIESGNLWYSIVGHFTNNATAVIITYLVNTKQILPDVETFGKENFIISMVSALLMVTVMVLFGKLIEKNALEFN
jgi:membrane protease YdiL (CAAX protease family)